MRKSLDAFSIIIGIVISTILTSLRDIVSYAVQNKPIEKWGALIGFLAASIVLLVVLLAIYLKENRKK